MEQGKYNTKAFFKRGKTFRAFKNFAVPLWAIVPRQSTSSCLVIPIPVSLHKTKVTVPTEWNRKKNNQKLIILRNIDNPIIFINLNSDIKINGVLHQFRLCNTQKPQLIQGITCITVNKNAQINRLDNAMQRLVNNKDIGYLNFPTIIRKKFEVVLVRKGTLRSKFQLVELASCKCKVKQPTNNKSITGPALPKTLPL